MKMTMLVALFAALIGTTIAFEVEADPPAPMPALLAERQDANCIAWCPNGVSDIGMKRPRRSSGFSKTAVLIRFVANNIL